MILILFAARIAKSQNYFQEKRLNTDSLVQLLDKATGKERISVLCLLANQLRLDHAEQAVPYAEEAYRMAMQSDDPRIELRATHALALAYHHTGDYAKAVRYGLDAYDEAKALHDTNLIFQVGQCIVLSYLYSFNQEMAIRYAFNILDNLDSWSHPAQQFEKSIRIGWIYMMSGHYREAIPYYLETERYAFMTDRVQPEKIALNYSHIANCYLHLAKNDSAKIYLDTCEKYCVAHRVDFSDFALELKGDYFVSMGEYDSALACFSQMVMAARQKGNLLDWASNLFMIGETCKLSGNTIRAVEAYLEAIEKATMLAENRIYFLDTNKTIESWYTPEQIVPHYMERVGLRIQDQAHTALYEIYKSRDDSHNALIHLEMKNIASNRLKELDKQKDVMEINTRYETERKEQQLQLLSSEYELNAVKLEQTRYFLFGLAGFIILALSVTILLIRQSRMKTIQDKTILEQRLLRAQMNPHFLFNSLSNIQGYMLENDALKANHYLSRFARLVRNILENTSRDNVSMQQEISTIENYIELQKIRYEGKFDYEINVDEDIDPESTFIPPMLAQPFIENAIEHGIRHLPSKGMITITISPYQSSQLHTCHLLCFEITDNGVGREQSAILEQPNNNSHRPMATSITRDRLRVLGHKVKRGLRKEIGMEINDLRDEQGKVCGTHVSLVIPFEIK